MESGCSECVPMGVQIALSQEGPTYVWAVPIPGLDCVRKTHCKWTVPNLRRIKPGSPPWAHSCSPAIILAGGGRCWGKRGLLETRDKAEASLGPRVWTLGNISNEQWSGSRQVNLSL